MEERGSDGWSDGVDRWWMRLTEWDRKIIPKTGWCIMERAICDFERGRWGWTSDGDERWRTSATRRLNRDQVMDISRLSDGERVLYVRERILYSMRSLTFSQWRDLRIRVVWKNLGAFYCKLDYCTHWMTYLRFYRRPSEDGWLSYSLPLHDPPPAYRQRSIQSQPCLLYVELQLLIEGNYSEYGSYR